MNVRAERFPRLEGMRGNARDAWPRFGRFGRGSGSHQRAWHLPPRGAMRRQGPPWRVRV
jgi:hypothetical protein